MHNVQLFVVKLLLIKADVTNKLGFYLIQGVKLIVFEVLEISIEKVILYPVYVYCTGNFWAKKEVV